MAEKNCISHSSDLTAQPTAGLLKSKSQCLQWCRSHVVAAAIPNATTEGLTCRKERKLCSRLTTIQVRLQVQIATNRARESKNNIRSLRPDTSNICGDVSTNGHVSPASDTPSVSLVCLKAYASPRGIVCRGGTEFPMAGWRVSSLDSSSISGLRWSNGCKFYLCRVD